MITVATLLLVLGALCLLAQATTINIWKHRYPFYHGYGYGYGYPYYGYPYHSGYGGINLGFGYGR